MLLIGLCGRAGSGKSTAARILVDHHNFARKPFAFRLKAMVAALGIPSAVLDGTPEDKSQPRPELAGHTVRYALQTLGTEWGRQHMGADFWVQLWRYGIDGMPAVVADDVRFSNEVEAIKALGGTVIRLEREGSGLSGSAGSHASENVDRLRVDYTIHNNGSEADLAAALSDAVFGLKFLTERAGRTPRSLGKRDRELA